MSLFTGEVPTLTIAELENIIAAIIPTAWLKPESLGAKVEENAAKEDAGRTRDDGHVGELRGALKIKTGDKLEPGETLCTLPKALRPKATRYVLASSGVAATTTTPNRLKIATTGVVTVAVAVAEGTEVFLDGVSYPIS
jgi:hypothetical protein